MLKDGFPFSGQPSFVFNAPLYGKLALEENFMKVVLFSVSYSRLLLGVMLGVRQTPYPLGVLWRWRHDRYRNL